MIKTGDTVFHRPTGERWLVAFTDYERDDIAWFGWPEGYARISDCDLVKSCSEDKSLELVRQLASIDRGNDIRCQWARRRLAELGEEPRP